jgi:hypothetical protein
MTTAEEVMKNLLKYHEENSFALVGVDQTLQFVFTDENIGWWWKIAPDGTIEKIEKTIKPKDQNDVAFIFAKADCLQALLDKKKSLKDMMPTGEFKFEAKEMGYLLKLQPFFTVT